MTHFLSFLTVLFLALPARVSQEPNFSGHWVWDAEKSRALVGKDPQTPGGPLEWTIAQTPTQITMDRPWPTGGPQHYVYQLDNSVSVNVIGAITYRTTCRWDGGRLVIEGTMSRPVNDQPQVGGTVKETRWLTPAGDLAIISIRTVYALSGPPTTLTQVFVKR